MTDAATDLPELPQGAFAKADPSPDALFYHELRLVTHIDGAAIAAVTALYRALVPPGGVALDLMGSWVSHLPPEVAYAEVIGHGMNEQELAANPRLSRYFVQDLNQGPALPLASVSVDAALICVSIQYLQQPVAVLREVMRVLRPGGVVAITFSNRCFPTKAVAIWQALRGPDRTRAGSSRSTWSGQGSSASRRASSCRGAGPIRSGACGDTRRVDLASGIPAGYNIGWSLKRAVRAGPVVNVCHALVKPECCDDAVHGREHCIRGTFVQRRAARWKGRQCTCL